MANVYLSYMPSGTPVAIKVVKPEFADDLEFRRRFRQEVSAAQRVQGRYTAPVVDADPEGQPPWLAAAYIAGPSLHRAVAEHGPLPLASVLRLVVGVAEGLASIHTGGLIHRDLKPSNVLLTGDGPRVIDFGLAYAAESSALTSTGVVIGTPAFMSPEQVAGKPITPATDVFALGHLAVFAATGHTAFGEGHQAAIIHRIANEQPNLSDCPAELLPVVERCLARDPAGRPSVTDVLASARAALSAIDSADPGASWLPQPITASLPSYDSSLAPRPAPTGSSADSPADSLADSPSWGGPGGVAPGLAMAPPGYLAAPLAGREPPARRGRRRLAYVGAAAAVVAIAFIIGILVAPGGSHSSSATSGTAPGVTGNSHPAPGPSTTPAQSTAQGSPSPGTTTPDNASSLPGGFFQEYTNVAFRMPGGGCSGSFNPSSVAFSSTAPHVTSNGTSQSYNGDLWLGCGDTPIDIVIYPGNQAALVSGSLDGAACEAAVTRHPISGPIPFAELKPRMQLCLSTATGQLVLLTMVSKDATSYDTNWTATAWSVPSTG
jgi:serine/threonine protein kinase